MKLIEEVTNPNFQAAYKYVSENYAYLFYPSLKAVKLLTQQHHARIHPIAGGLHLRRNNESVITIKHGYDNIATYVEILVHELTHLQQFTTGRAPGMTEEEMEAEAYPAGHAARALYEYKELLEMTEGMRRRRA